MKKILITSGTGVGSTKLSAFDSALADAGVSNYNLIYLSSVIPPGFHPHLEKPATKPDDFGKRLYVVMAEHRESVPGIEAWAGIGWVMKKDNTAGGLFVEHHGNTKEEVEGLIKNSLLDMIASRGGKEKFGKMNTELAGKKCENAPVCALVTAVYQAEDWA